MSEKHLAYIFGFFFLLAILLVVVFGDGLSAQQVFFLRLIAAVAAAGAAAVIPGFLDVSISLTGLAIRATGAIAVFVLVFLVNPPPIENGGNNKVPVETEGFLGNLYDHLNARVSADEFTFTFDRKDAAELRDFYIASVISGATYGELFAKICRAYGCLVCTPEADSITDRVKIGLNVEKLAITSDSQNLERKRKICP